MMTEILDKFEARGEIRGIEKGRAEGIRKTLISLVYDGLITTAEAAKRMQITEQEFEELMEK